MVKVNKYSKLKSDEKRGLPSFFVVIRNILIVCILTFIISSILGIYYYQNNYYEKIYPGVKIDDVDAGGKTREEIEKYIDQINKPFDQIQIKLELDNNNIATISGTDLNVSYDSKLSAQQAYLIGRSNHIFSDIYQKIKATSDGIQITKLIRMNTGIIDDTLDSLADNVDIQPQDALFQFDKGKVINFKPSTSGRKLNKEKTKKIIRSSIENIIKENSDATYIINVKIPIDIISPNITTDNSNNFGIKELIGIGTSKYAGSIQGRIHNVELAASRIHGHLIPPGNEFSFNDALGDVSASTGFQPAYIIKDGRTVLGDGGGVCQVSTTLFRAALNAGLPITERHAHAYRVHYYEEDTPPGIDATVYGPSYDLKFKNDTQNYILIQMKNNPTTYSLVFELYGTSDGRKVEMTKPVISSQIPPPPDEYQDDPTLPNGVVKQVDWKAWGARVSFEYKVIRDNDVLIKEKYYSNYQPWKSIFLRGTKS
jgi:vancomycin resistance protein YoaR